MRKYHVWFAVVVLWVTGVASATGQEMMTWTSTEGRFTVQLPFVPINQIQQKTEEIPLQGTDKGTRHEFWVEVDSGPEFVIYFVMYDDYPPDSTNEAPQVALARSRDVWVKGMTLVSDKAIDLNGIPGREWTASNDHANMTARQFLQGSRLYSVVVLSSKGATATLTSQFLNSFKIQ
jgi:hypothetical protein